MGATKRNGWLLLEINAIIKRWRAFAIPQFRSHDSWTIRSYSTPRDAAHSKIKHCDARKYFSVRSIGLDITFFGNRWEFSFTSIFVSHTAANNFNNNSWGIGRYLYSACEWLFEGMCLNYIIIWHKTIKMYVLIILVYIFIVHTITDTLYTRGMAGDCRKIRRTVELPQLHRRCRWQARHNGSTAQCGQRFLQLQTLA